MLIMLIYNILCIFFKYSFTHTVEANVIFNILCKENDAKRKH